MVAMKNIVLHVAQDKNFEGRLQAALDVVRAGNGHLTCVQSTPLTSYVSMDMFGGAYVIPEVLERIEQETTDLRASVEARLGREGVSWNFTDVSGDAGISLLDHGTLADLIVLSRASAEKPDTMSHALIGDVVMAVRAPLLILPPDTNGLDLKGTAVVAWNGSFESANALRASVPLLLHAQTVRIAVIGEESQDRDDRRLDACTYLSRHGVAAELSIVPAGSATVSDALEDFADRQSAAYVVMGAYGHSRAREFFFGGVTRAMLRSGSRPLVLAR